MRFTFLFGAITGALLILAACGANTGTSSQNGLGDAARGRSAILGYGCEACHTIPGINNAQAKVGPPLEHWNNRRFIAGELSNQPDNLVKWLMNPQAIEPGNAMPNLSVNEQAARDIAAYLYTLQ